MLVLRKQPSVRIIDGVNIYPGLNGDVPERLMQNDSFQFEVKHGIMEIMSQNKGAGVDKSLVDRPDEGVIEAVLKAKTGEALKMVRNTLKIATILELKKKEKRPSVLDEICNQEILLTKDKEV
jgi:hypothetical protein